MNLQHSHNSAQFKARSFPITIVCDKLQSPANLGSLFRLCDAFGIKEVVLCGPEINLDTPRLLKTARGSQKQLSISQFDSPAQFLAQLNSQKYLCLALEHSTKSIAIGSFELLPRRPVLLFIGNEQGGISQPVLDSVDHTLHIEMYGVNSSMNVIQATAIALYELTQKLLGQR